MNDLYEVFIETHTGEFYYLGLTDKKISHTNDIKNNSMGISNLKRTTFRESPEMSFDVVCCGMSEEAKYKMNKIIKNKLGKYETTSEEIEVEENFDIIEIGELYKHCNVYIKDMLSNKYSTCTDSTLQRINEDKYKVLFY